MKKQTLARVLAPLCVLSFVAAACGGDDDEGTTDTTEATADSTPEATAAPEDTTAPTDGGESTVAEATDTTTGEASSAAIWDNGECDSSLDVYKVGINAPFETAILSLVDQVDALEASVEAFNARGGIGGHCMEVVKCDSKMDPNAEADCSRELLDSGVVVTLNDTTPAGSGADEVLKEAELARLGVSPGVPELLDDVVNFPIGLGGTGTTFAQLVTCLQAGHTKIAAIHVDTASIQQLFDLLGTMNTAYGAEFVAKLPVPAGTTDFQQFILASEDAGATCAILPLGENEALQVLNAANELGTEMLFAASLGTFGTADLAEFGDFASQMLFNAEIPPITGDQERWPLLAAAIEDLAASGKDELQVDQIKSSPFRSWLAVYSLVRIVEDFGTPDDVTPAAVITAIRAATDVDLGGLIPAWTPTAKVEGSIFPAVSQPWYYQATFDPASGSFVVSDTLIHLVNEVNGVIDYPQP